MGWQQFQSAVAAGVGIATIRRIARTTGVINAQFETVEKIRRALVEVGVEFIGEPKPGVCVQPMQLAIAYFAVQKHRSSASGRPDLTAAELNDPPLELYRGIDDIAIPSSTANDLQARRQGAGPSPQRQSHGRISNEVERCRVSHERFADVTAPRSNPNIVRAYQGCRTGARGQNEKLNLLKKGRNLRRESPPCVLGSCEIANTKHARTLEPCNCLSAVALTN